MRFYENFIRDVSLQKKKFPINLGSPLDPFCALVYNSLDFIDVKFFDEQKYDNKCGKM